MTALKQTKNTKTKVTWNCLKVYMFSQKLYQGTNVYRNFFSLDSIEKVNTYYMWSNSTISKITNNQCGDKLKKDSGKSAKAKSRLLNYKKKYWKWYLILK